MRCDKLQNVVLTVCVALLTLYCFSVRGKDHCPILIKAVEAAVVDLPEINIKAEFITPDTIAVKLENQSKNPVRVRLKIDKLVKPVNLAFGEVKQLKIPLPESNKSLNNITISAATAKKNYSFTCRKPKIISVPEISKDAIIIDGELKEYDHISPITVDVLSPPDAKAWMAWTGDDDLSVKAWLAHDETKLYIAALVKDDIHILDLNPRQMWKQDNLEFSIRAVDRIKDKSSFRFGIRKNVQQAYCWSSPVYPVGARLDRVSYRVQRKRNGITVYEIAIPFNDLKVSPETKELLEIRIGVWDCDTAGSIARYCRLLTFWNTRFILK